MRKRPNSMLNKWLWAALIIVTAACSVFIFLTLQKDLSVNGTTAGAETDQSGGVLETEEAIINTPAITLTPVPSVKPTQTPQSKLTPEPVTITFVESSELRLPSLEENLQYGQIFNLRGTVESSQSLTSVTVRVLDEEIKKQPLLEARVNFSPSDRVRVYALDDAETPQESVSINGQLSFKSLQAGGYTLEILASAENAENLSIATTDFFVDEPSEWLQLTSNNFRDNYSHALAFFQRTDRFMFKYKWAEERNIITDPKWVRKYITSIQGINGEDWKVHVDAVPSFEEAIEYLDNTYVRVQGNGHDSGVIKLSKLIKSFNGAYYSRFVTDKTFISHHAFGTAVDLNAFIEPNNNVIENHDIIKYEVEQCLEYNGIKNDGKKNYHDFLYTGDWQEYYREIPTSLLNYLLYELAFFRAGFGWGYYYSHTCDAMHFTLSERDITEHDDDSAGLRKVFEY